MSKTTDELKKTNDPSNVNEPDQDILQKCPEINLTHELNSKISYLEQELTEQRNTAMRALADLDNSRKRMIKERAEIKNTVTANIIESFISAFDNFEIGLQSVQQHDTSGLFTGFKIIYDQFKAILSDLGVTILDPINLEFDVNLHDCVRMEFSEKTENGKIMSVLRKGYMLKDKMIRPATVVVSKGSQKESKEDNSINK